jgi:RNA polymerase sigma factor (sigma-70 family)
MAALLTLFRHATRTAPAVPDSELLSRFANERDEDAFAELVQRHGPVVYRICRRLVGPDAAEDAFQAVFLVLATRLQAARGANSVGGWLVGVAGRVARQMRRATHRRSRHETAATESRPVEVVEPPGDLTEQFRVLDEELARLPDYLRDPVVLCFLQGRTQEQAAAELGRDARTLRRRLDRAKSVLRARLERRGVLPAVAAALVGGAGSVCADVPAALAERTVSMVFDFLTGGTAAAGSAPVVLAKGVATTMLTRKLMSSVVAVAAGLIGLGVVFAGDGPPVAAPTTPAALPTPTAAAPPAKVPMANPIMPPLLPAAPATEFDWQKEETRRRGAVAGVRATDGDRIVLIEAMCLRVPAGFCERSGLTAEESSLAWILTQREQRMFTALLRAEKLQGGLDVLTRPMMTALDGQTAHCEVGHQAEVVTGLEAETKDGKTVYKAKLSKVDLGVVLRVTPKIAASGQVQLRIETQISELVGTGSPLAVPVVPAGGNADGGKLGTVPLGHLGTNKQAVQATVIVTDTGTVILRTELPTARGAKPAHETLWVLTTHIIRNDKDKKPAAGGPAPTPPFPVTGVASTPAQPAAPLPSPPPTAPVRP